MTLTTSEGRGRAAFWILTAQFALTVFVAGYFAYVTDAQNDVLAKQAIRANHDTQEIVAEVQKAGACTTTKLLKFIIYASARRSERLGASNGLSEATQQRIRSYVKDSCGGGP